MRVVILDDCLERDVFIALDQLRALKTSLLLAHARLRIARGGDSVSGMKTDVGPAADGKRYSETGPEGQPFLDRDSQLALEFSEEVS